MPRNRGTGRRSEAAATTQLTFTDGELEALRGIVRDWINEELATEPYPADFASVRDKLGVVAQGLVAARRAPAAPLQPNLG